MVFIIVLAPLLSSIISGFFGFKLGHKGVAILNCSLISVCFLTSFYFFLDNLFNGSVVSFSLFPWILSGEMELHWGFLFDSLTVVILIVVTSISLLVHFYSISYIAEDPHLSRFISYLSLFTFFIVILVTSDNFVQIFVGWEGVGLCSYLLINFWFTRIQANKAAIKAMLVNRVGDFGLALGILLLYFKFGSFDYSVVFSLVPFFSIQKIYFFFEMDYLSLVSLLLFIGAIGKSAQIGLHTWLPDAMEGPTPVSALIHAATMVTAGVFLISRCSPVFEFAPRILWIITIVGACTAFFAASTGLLQNDLKKVIAYSTCSQLGYIIFSCGISSYDVGIFHLANHAFFKALLFLTAGCIIHSMNDEQDFRKIGGLSTILPFSYFIVFSGSLALIGFPFLSGFYSKDVILEVAFAQFSNEGHFAFWLGSMGAFLTAFYSIRLLFFVFLAPTNGFKRFYEMAHESSFVITFPLIVLFFGSLFFGFLIKDSIIGLGSNFFQNALFVHPFHFRQIEAEFLPLSIKLIPLVFSMLGMCSSFVFYFFNQSFLFNIKTSFFGRSLFVFWNRKWFFDKFFNENIVQVFLDRSYHFTYVKIDKGFFEMFGPYGLTFCCYTFINKLQRIQTGQLYHYTFIIIIGFLFSIFITFFSFDFRLFFIILLFFFI
uniref:NADH-ubiquinone oxidoreductase chain 5 n=1 Tax=Thraustochytrium aureum TaxID=42467 RepID=Q9G4D1_9STRA|nr:NADH dehydrogenase subunit 5 [Thraustochytrium aureum]